MPSNNNRFRLHYYSGCYRYSAGEFHTHVPERQRYSPAPPPSENITDTFSPDIACATKTEQADSHNRAVRPQGAEMLCETGSLAHLITTVCRYVSFDPDGTGSRRRFFAATVFTPERH